MFKIHIKPSTRTASAHGLTILEAADNLANEGDADDASNDTTWHITVSMGEAQILHSEVVAPTWDLAIARFKQDVLGVRP